MRRRSRGADVSEKLCWGFIAKGLMGPEVVVALGERVDMVLKLVEAAWQVGVALVSPG